MRPKDLALTIILWLGAFGFTFIVIAIEALPMLIVSLLAVIAWIAFIFLAIRDRERDKQKLKNPTLWMVVPDQNGVKHWTAMDGSGRTRPLHNPPPEQTIRSKETEKKDS